MNQEIRSKLDRICNILWAGGLAVPTLFVEQISYLIYLKLLDEREAELELKARLLKGKRQRQAAVPRPGEPLPLEQLAVQERQRTAQFPARRRFPLHGLAAEGRAAGRDLFSGRRNWKLTTRTF